MNLLQFFQEFYVPRKIFQLQAYSTDEVRGKNLKKQKRKKYKKFLGKRYSS